MTYPNRPKLKSGDIINCPLCGFPSRIVKREGGHADHYEPAYFTEVLANQDSDTAEKLRELRRGKRSVAIVGTAPTSCALAPYEDESCDIWGITSNYECPWFRRWTAWFELHKKERFSRPIKARYYKWLQESHGKPIYMEHVYTEVPDSVEYPLHGILTELLGNVQKGDESPKYFTSSLSYMLALAIYQKYERIEVYGFEMAADDEYAGQKGCAEFWLGLALGKGVEVYLPPNNLLLFAPMYGYSETKFDFEVEDARPDLIKQVRGY